jgi:hypothetical protein
MIARKPGPFNPPKLLSKNPLYMLRFVDFLITYSQRKTCEVPSRYRVDTGEDSAVGTNRYLHRWNKGLIAMLKILAGTLPLSADPRAGFLHKFDFEAVLPALKMTVDCNFPV